MTIPGQLPVTGRSPTRRAAAAVLASICLAAGCTTSMADDGSAAAAAGGGPAQATIAGDSTAPSTSVAPPSVPSLHELLAQERFVALAVALERSGLEEVIEGLDDFVLFAPTGTAFATAGADVGVEYSTLMNNPQLLEAIMRYHVVADPSTTNPSWRTLNGSALDVRRSDRGTVERVDGVEVLSRIPVRNGSVLMVPRLLLPGSEQDR